MVDHGKEPWNLSWVRRKVKTGGKQAVTRKKKNWKVKKFKVSKDLRVKILSSSSH